MTGRRLAAACTACIALAIAGPAGAASEWENGDSVAEGARLKGAAQHSSDPGDEMAVYSGMGEALYASVVMNLAGFVPHVGVLARRDSAGFVLSWPVWDCNGGSNQNWIFSSAQNGSVQIQNQWSGKCLWDGGVWTQNGSGAPIQSNPCGANNSSSPSWHQIWPLVTYN